MQDTASNPAALAADVSELFCLFLPGCVHGKCSQPKIRVCWKEISCTKFVRCGCWCGFVSHTIKISTSL